MRMFRPRTSVLKWPKQVERQAYKNSAEDKFFQSATMAGWKVTKRGWPDFIIRRNGRVAFVEVKKAGGQTGAFLKPSQMTVMDDLVQLGAECYLWTPDRGFSRIKPRSANKQASNPTGKVGDERGSQSTGAIPISERGHIAVVKTVTSGRKG